MSVRDIVHVELYTRDKVEALDHLVGGLGFTRVGDFVTVDRSSVLLSQGDVRLVLTSGWGTRRFIADHGEGVADIAVSCDDVTATRDAALAAGGRVTRSPQGHPVVRPPGGVGHSFTLLPSASPQSVAAAEPGSTPTPAAGARAGRVQRLDHMEVRLTAHDLRGYAAFLEGVFGLTHLGEEHRSDRLGAEDIVLRGAPNSVEFVLTAPRHQDAAEPCRKDPAEPYRTFPARSGASGVGRLFVLVDDLHAARREFQTDSTRYFAGSRACGTLVLGFTDRRGLPGFDSGGSGARELQRASAPIS